MKIYKCLFIIITIWLLAVISPAREISWFPQTVVSSPRYNATLPTITSIGKNVHLAWQGEERDARRDIYYTRSTDGGHNFEIIRKITDDGVSTEPRLINDEGTLYLFWYATAGQKKLYYSVSSDNGLTWSAAELLTDLISYHYNSTLTVKGEKLFLVWQENSLGLFQIYYQTSADFGKHWEPKRQLTFSRRGATNPELSLYKNTLLVVWSESLKNGQTVNSAQSLDWGDTWQRNEAEELATELVFAPGVALTEQFAYLTWQDKRNGNLEIYCKILDSPPPVDILQLSENFTPSTSPKVAIAGQTVHVCWQDFVGNNSRIFYRRSTFARIYDVRHVDNDPFPNYDNDDTLEFTWKSAQECATYKIIVYVNGKEDHITTSPTASLELPAKNTTLYKIQVFGLDQEGNESLPSSESASIYVDLYQPRVRIISPANNEFLRDDLPPVILKISENETGFKEAAFRVNGEDVPIKIEPLQKRFIYIPATNYPEGENNFSLKLVDMANNQTTANWHFTVDYTPPRLDIEPIYLNEIVDEVVVRGTFRDLGIDTISTHYRTARINRENHSFIMSALWNYGDDIIEIEAVDKAGNRAEFVARVIFDQEPPVFSELSPPPNAQVAEKKVRIAALVRDAGPAGLDRERVTIYFNDEDVTGFAEWEDDYLVYYVKKIDKRQNNIKIIATDKAGNKEEISWTYINTRGNS